MPRTEIPLTPVFTRWLGSWQVRLEPRPLTAKARFRRACITARVMQAGVGTLPFADPSFDFVMAAQVLEHLPEPVAALAELRRVLRPGGRVVTGTMRQYCLGARIHTKWRTRLLTPRRVRAWLRAAGLAAAELDEPAGVCLCRLTRLTAI